MTFTIQSPTRDMQLLSVFIIDFNLYLYHLETFTPDRNGFLQGVKVSTAVKLKLNTRKNCYENLGNTNNITGFHRGGKLYTAEKTFPLQWKRSLCFD